MHKVRFSIDRQFNPSGTPLDEQEQWRYPDQNNADYSLKYMNMAKKKAATKPPKKTEKPSKSESKSDSSSSAEEKDTAKDSTAEPNNYTLGERQKPVTNSYRASWDRIFRKGA